MSAVRTLEPYRDDRGNEIIYEGEPRREHVSVRFAGDNNRLYVAENAKIVSLSVDFAGDGGQVEILPTSRPRTGLRLSLRIGHSSKIHIGENVGTTNRAFISAVEGAEVRIGYDCMIATGVEIRTDDAHPIYGVRTGKRINPSESIEIRDHVWIAKNAVIMGGVTIGTGSVVGFGSIVTRNVPNNSIAAGAPARVVKRHIAWERPVLRTRRPGQVVPAANEKNAEYWNLTEETTPDVVPVERQLRRGFAQWFTPRRQQRSKR
ncbi:acyltransferase [Microbacterium sp. ARD32]|uniref:acyltransferase n=1 Tax=Microbacterium sp. ARD32 TaxID=2962577 RepID=UPI00288142D8|nr:acyltransferase [Microbacterium sp. ARD32]MDT0156408.1 acyltransferase [Microbacterium sp. ARD32]